MQVTIKMPDNRKVDWSTSTLVRVMCEINGLYTSHMEDLKAEARRRTGQEGGKLTDGRTRSVTVGKQEDAKTAVDYAAIGKYLLDTLTPEKKQELIELFTTQKAARKQSVIMR